MNINRNPYSPPRAHVADIAVAQATSVSQTKRSLLPLWAASFYCIVIGMGHAVALAIAVYRARYLLDWPMPPWVYALGFVQPVARIAGGVSFIRRSRFSPLLLAALVGVTVLFPILWQLLRTGTVAVPSGPLAWLGLADLMLLLLIARYAFVLRSRGALR